MSEAFVQANSTSSASTASQSTTFSLNVTSGNLLLVAVAVQYSPTVTVSDNLNGSYSLVGTYGNFSTLYTSLWLYSGTAGGSCTTAVIPSSSSHAVTVIVAEYSGIAITSPVRATSSNSGSTSSASTGTVASASGDLVIAVCGIQPNTGATSATVASPFTLRRSSSSSVSLAGLFLADHTNVTGSASATFTLNSTGFWATNAGAFVPPPAGQPFFQWLPRYGG